MRLNPSNLIPTLALALMSLVALQIATSESLVDAAPSAWNYFTGQNDNSLSVVAYDPKQAKKSASSAKKVKDTVKNSLALVVAKTTTSGSKTPPSAKKPKPVQTEPLSEEETPEESPVEYLKLVLSWLPGFCTTQDTICRSDLPKEFQIQQLLPVFKPDVDSSEFCKGRKFNLKEIDSSLNKKLTKHWSSVSSNKHELLWARRWEDDGKCATTVKGLESIGGYFSFAAKSFKQVDILNSMKRADISPSETVIYDGEETLNSLHDQLGFRPSLSCSSFVNKFYEKSQVLTSVDICYDSNLKAIDCPEASNTCIGDVMIPSKTIQAYRMPDSY